MLQLINQHPVFSGLVIIGVLIILDAIQQNFFTMMISRRKCSCKK